MANANKYLDKDGLLYLWGLIKQFVSNSLQNKVDKVSGKQLSSNDYTNEEKNKLNGIVSGAQVNVIESIKVNGVIQEVTEKSVNISVPTDNALLSNGAGYQNSSQVQQAINSALSGIAGIDFQVVAELPQSGSKGIIYLMTHEHGTADSYDEYIWLSDSNKYEKIGNTDVDLSAYLKATDMVAISNGEIDSVVSA